MAQLRDLRRKMHHEILMPFCSFENNVVEFKSVDGKVLSDFSTFQCQKVVAHSDIELPFGSSLIEIWCGGRLEAVVGLMRLASVRAWEATLLKEVYIRPRHGVQLKMWSDKAPPEDAAIKLVGLLTVDAEVL